MATAKKYSGIWMFIAFVLALLAYGLREIEKRDAPTSAEELAGAVRQSLVSEADEGADGLVHDLAKARVTARGFDVLKDCSLEEHVHNDGDSFHVRHGRHTTEFRLYYVDTPESKYKTYPGGEDNGQRIREQGQYFGGLDRAETTTVGSEAKKFTLELLRKQKFTVVTKWENVFNPDRKHAFVLVEWKGKQIYLHELLVAQGLARIHTKPSTLPDNTPAGKQRAKLKELEEKAKAARRGAWSL